MNKHSFSSRLSFKTVLIGIVIFLVTLMAVASVGGKIMQNHSITYAKTCLHTSVLEAESTIAIIENTTNGIARTAEEFLGTGAKLDTARCYRLLQSIVESSPFILGCGFYFEPYKYDKKNYYSGIYANRDKYTGEIAYEWDDDKACAEDGWDYFSLEWYSEAKKEMRSNWTPPSLENMTTYYQLMTTYTYPLKNEKGKMYGVLATDLSLDFLQTQLEEIRPYEHSNVVVADENYKFICNPIAEDPFSGTMYDTPFIPGMGTVINRIEIMPDGNLIIREGMKRAFLVFDKMKNGWNLAVAVIYSDAFKDLFTLWFVMLGIAVFGCILLYLISRAIIHRESRPLVDFANAASKITDGRFDVPIPQVKNEDEIKELGNALSYMQESVTNYIEELKRTTSEKERLASELNVAHAIQNQMLTKTFPSMDGCSVYASSIPAKEVGGDLYDVFISDDELFFIVGDVSGKGVPAALLMAITIAAFRASVKKGKSTAEIVSLINDTFCKSNEDLMFVTLIVGKLDMNPGELEFCNGGHNPMVYTDSKGDARFIHAKPNIACGAFSGFPYQEERIKLDNGSRLIIYTDGVTEAETTEKDQFGEDRLLEWTKAYAADISHSNEDCIKSLGQQVKGFTADAIQNDDITMMAISRD